MASKAELAATEAPYPIQPSAPLLPSSDNQAAPQNLKPQQNFQLIQSPPLLPSIPPSQAHHTYSSPQQIVCHVKPVSVRSHVTIQSSVGSKSTCVICPTCKSSINTRIKREVTNYTHIFAGFFCIIGCCFCAWIPYCMDTCKGTTHFCPNCGMCIGSYKV